MSQTFDCGVAAEAMMKPGNGAVRVTICVITRDRPAGVRRLLRSLSSLEVPDGYEAAVLLVDNGAREPIVGESVQDLRECCGPLELQIIREVRIGIPFARNAAVEAALETSDLVAFVDDDETVEADWLVTMCRALERSDVDVVAGPVVTQFDPDVPSWWADSGCFNRRRLETGAAIEDVATGNVLVRAEVYRTVRPLFDERLALSGGEDHEYFTRVHAAGRAMCWCDEAIVYEHTGRDRANLFWVIRRALRIGAAQAASVRPRMTVVGSVIASSRAFLRGIRELTLTAITLRHGRGPAARRIQLAARRLGRGLGYLGWRGKEYKRVVGA